MADGAVRTVEPVDGTRYPGFYAGQVRFVFAEVPGTIVSATVYGDGGAELGDAEVVLAPRFEKTERIPGTPLVGATLAGKRVQLPCIALRSDLRANACRREAADLAVGAAATCSPRRLVLFGLLPRDATGVTVLLPNGEAVATVVGDAWFAELAPGRRTVGLRVTGPVPNATTLELPSARIQCGYQLLQS